MWILLFVACLPGPDTATPVGAGRVSATMSVTSVVCEQPELRASHGPLFEPELGEPWSARVGGSRDVEPAGAGAAVRDLDGDGALDLLLTRPYQHALYLQQPDGTLVLDDRRWPWDPAWRTVMVSFADADDDGDPDAVVVNRGQAPVFLRNHAGWFEIEDVGLSTSPYGRVGAAWGDLDGDGDLDLVLAGHSARLDDSWREAMTGDPTEVYLQEDGRFVDITDTLPDRFHQGFTYAVALLHADGDLRPDLFLANDHGWLGGDTNNLWLNRSTPGGLALDDVTETSGVGVHMAGMGVGLGDLNGDGVDEIAVTGWGEIRLFESYLPESAAVDTTVARWVEAQLARGLVPEPGSVVGWGIALADLDHDGDLDVPAVFGEIPPFDGPVMPNPMLQPDQLFVMGDGQHFEEQGDAWAFRDEDDGRALAVVDLNQDGFLDLITQPLRAPGRVRLSRCDDSAWLTLSLKQPPPNLDAIGARVEVVTGELTIYRDVRADGHSLTTSTPPTVHFGLGDADVVDELRIRWPDGRVTELTDVPTRAHLRVERD